MKITCFSSLLIGLILIATFSCNRFENQEENNRKPSDSNLVYFQKAQEVQQVKDRLYNLNKSLAFVKNRRGSRVFNPGPEIFPGKTGL